jgi:hypothetical protein
LVDACEEERVMVAAKKPMVRKLLVTDIRCRTCDAPPGEPCWPAGKKFAPDTNLHGARIADHAEFERAGWEWQDVDPRDDGVGREETAIKSQVQR